MLRACVGFAVALSAGLASAQDLQQLRQQIAALQQQLDALENQPASKRNVTQIGATRGRKATGGLVIRIYELNDLFAVAPPYAAQVASDLNAQQSSSVFASIPGPMDGASGAGRGFGGGGFGGGGFFSLRTGTAAASALAGASAGQFGTAETVKSSQDELIKVIRETIAPDLWESEGKITRLGNAFIISADEDTHEQIELLLNLFRARWGTLRTISVRAWWIPMATADLRTLLDAPDEKLAPDGPPVFGLVGDAAWQKILQAWQQPAGDQPLSAYQATVTAYNGQTVSTMSGTQSLAVSRMEAVATDETSGESLKSVGYNPIVSVVQEGLAFQVTPISNVTGKTVLLDVHSRLTLPAGESKADRATDRAAVPKVLPGDAARPLDRRRLLVHRLSTTARVPADRPYLIGGMSLAAPDNEGRQLYLFVKVSVQELRNDQEPETKPVDEPPKEKPETAKPDAPKPDAEAKQ